MNSYPRREFLLRALAACGTPFLMPLASVEGLQKPQAGTAAAGNGSEEVRNWLVAQGMAGNAPLELLLYRPVANWYTGIGVAQWRLATQ